MHWRHWTNNKCSEDFYTVHGYWKYNDIYYNDHYITDSPITLKTFGICARDPKSRIVNRYSEKYVLHFILSGKGWCNGIPFEAGDIVFCTSFRPYNFASDHSDPCTYAWVTFNGGKSEKYIDQLGLNQPFKKYKSAFPERIAEVLHDMMEIDHLDVDTDLYLESCLIRLLSLSQPPTQTPPAKPAKKEKRVSTAIRYISEHFRESELSLEEVALATQSNEKYLQRIFKNEMGMSVYQYISKLRLDAAVTLLSSSNYNVNEISEYVGYNDRRTFTVAFKKRFGVSPTRYTHEN